jgi:hypothetical protein
LVLFLRYDNEEKNNEEKNNEEKNLNSNCEFIFTVLNAGRVRGLG